MKRVVLLVAGCFACWFMVQAQEVELGMLEDESSVLVEKFSDAPVERMGNTYVCDGFEMSKREYRDFLYSRSPLAYDEFIRGYKLSTAGWVVFGVGLGAESLGLWFLCGATALLGSGSDGSWTGAFIVLFGSIYAIAMGVSLSAAGGVLLLASVPMLGVGYSRMHKSVDVYNVNLRSEATLSFGITSSENSVGLALRF